MNHLPGTDPVLADLGLWLILGAMTLCLIVATIELWIDGDAP